MSKVYRIYDCKQKFDRCSTLGQVALIAVNIIGFEMNVSPDGSSDGGGQPDAADAADGDSMSLVSICDDLSFSMYVEETITETVREMEAMKGNAVNGKQRFTPFFGRKV